MSLVKDISTPEQNFQERKKDWEAFKKENPHIYELFDKAVRDDIQYLYDKGLLWLKTVRARKIFENIKWKGVTTICPDGYAINNNHYKFYCLLWEYHNPQFAGVFEHKNYIPDIMRRIIEKNDHKKERAKKRYQNWKNQGRKKRV